MIMMKEQKLNEQYTPKQFLAWYPYAKDLYGVFATLQSGGYEIVSYSILGMMDASYAKLFTISVNNFMHGTRVYGEALKDATFPDFKIKKIQDFSGSIDITLEHV